MKVRMLVDVSGTRDGETWPRRGAELTVPDAEGADLCSQGLAEVVAEPAKPQKATARKAEKRG